MLIWKALTDTLVEEGQNIELLFSLSDFSKELFNGLSSFTGLNIDKLLKLEVLEQS